MAEYTKPVVFKLGTESYGVDINLVMSIEQQVNIVTVPNSVDYIKGIVNLRGQVIPVYDLKKRFGIKDGNVSHNTVVVNASGVVIALEVDAVMEISNIDPNNIVDMPVIVKTENTEYLDRVARVDDKLIILLDIEKLLSQDEAEGVKKFTDEMSSEKQ